MTADTPVPEPLGQRADLLARLRKVDPDEPGIRTRWMRNPDGHDAAREIEALAAANAALVKERDEADQRCREMDGKLFSQRAKCILAWRECDAALARAERLERALRRAAIAAEIESAGHAIAIIEAALATEPPMAAPISSHQHGGENARQQGGEEGIAPFSPPDTLATEPQS